MSIRNSLLSLVVVLAVFGPNRAQAQNPYTWNTTDGNWGTAANWLDAFGNPVAPPSTPNTQLIFGGTANYSTMNDIGSVQFVLNSLAITNTGTTTITSADPVRNLITFSGTTPSLALALGAGDATISSGVIYNNGTTITNASASTLLLNGSQVFLSNNTVCFINSSTGTITLADAIAYIGSNVTINLANTGGGTFNIGNMGNLRGGTQNTVSITAGTVGFVGVVTNDLFSDNTVLNVAAGATFNFNNNSETFGGLAGAGTINLGTANISGMVAPGNRTFSGVITGTGGNVVQASTGTLTLSGANTFTGNTAINRGTIALDFSATGAPATDILYNGITPALLTLGSGKLSHLGSATLPSSQTVASTTLSGSAGVSVTTGTDQNATVNLGAITRAAGTTLNVTLTNSGTGIAAVTTTTLNNASGILGGWATVNGSSWAVTSDIAGTNPITAYPEASYVTNTFNSGSKHVTLTSNQSPTAANVTASNTIRFNANAAVALTLTGTNTLQQGGILVTPNVGSFNDTISGGTLSAASGVDLVFNQQNTAGTLTVSSVLAGAATQNIIKTGPGTLILNGAPTFTGRYYFNEGVVQVGAVATLGPVTAGVGNNPTMTFNGGTMKFTTSYSPGSAVHIWTIGAGGGTIDVNTGFTVTRQGNTLFGSGPLVKNGLGQFSVGSNSSSFSGSLTINAGVLRLTSSQLQNVSSGTIAAGGQYFIDDDATATYRFANSAIMYLNGDGPSNGGAFRTSTQSAAASPIHTFSNEINLQTNARFSPTNWDTNNTTTLILSNIVSGPGGLIKDSTGTLELRNIANSYTGATIVSRGILRIGANDNVLPVTTTLQIGEAGSANSGTFDLNGKNQTIGNLTNAGTGTTNQVVNSSISPVTLTINYLGSGQTYSANLGGSGGDNFGIAKSGSGTFTLNGTRTYTGATNVIGGTLRLTPTTSSGDYTVNNAATLGVLVPATPATLTVPTITLGTVSSTINFELASAGSTVPLINVTQAEGLILSGGTHIINVASSVPLAPSSTIPLIQYAAATPLTSGFTLGTLPPRTVANIVYNSVTPSIDLNVIGVDSIKWVGSIDGTWDTGTSVGVAGTNNWKEVNSGTATNFVVGDNVLFNNVGVNTFNVVLNGAVQPASITVNSGTAYTFGGSGSITGTTGLSKSGSATLTLNTANTFTGATTITAGAIVLGNSLALQNSPVTVNASQGLAFTGITAASLASLTGTGSIVLTNDAAAAVTLTVNGNGDSTTYAGNLSGLGSLVKAGGGTLVLAGDNTPVSTSITLGAIQIGNGTTGSLSGTLSVPASTSLVINRSNDSSQSLSVAGAGNVSHIGIGTTTLTGEYGITGTTAVSFGKLAVSRNSSITFPSPTTVADASGFEASFGNGAAIVYSAATTVTGTGSVKLNLSGNATVNFTNTVALGASGTFTANVEAGSSLTHTNPITGTANYIKEGTGLVTLLANNSFSGTFTVNKGTVLLEDLGGSGDLNAASIIINNGGNFIFGPNGNTDFPQSTFVTLNTGGAFDLQQGEIYGGFILDGGEYRMSGGSNPVRTGVNSTLDSVTVKSGTITTIFSGGSAGGAIGSPIFDKITADTVTISGTVTFTATTPLTIKEGVLAMNGSNVPTSGAGLITISDATTAATLQLNGTVSAATTRSFTLGDGGGLGATINVVDVAATLSLNAAVTGTGGLTKSGNGTLLLTGANNYSGTTTLNAGTLRINGNNSGATGSILVNGGTLGGNGTLGGAVSNIAGTIRAGDTGSNVPLTLAQGLSTASGSTLYIDIFSGANPATISSGGSTTLDLLLNPTSNNFLNITGGTTVISPGTLVVIDGSTTTFLAGSYSYRIASGAGTLNGTLVTANQFSFIGVPSVDLTSASLTADGTGALFVNFAVTPEPTSLVAIAFVGVVGLFRRRK
ncbi:hypothetical protein BH11PLA2_BH11PLA2_02650 [soil metagenome]